jgi:pilus assembly protein Flp/PilA
MGPRVSLANLQDRGASAVEYAILVAAIAAVVIVAVFALGSTVKDSFSTTCDKVASGATPGSATCP